MGTLPEPWAVVPRCFSVLRGHTGPVWAAVLGTHNLYSASYDGSVRVWRLSDGLCVRVLEAHTGPMWCLALSENGRRLYSGSYDRCGPNVNPTTACAVTPTAYVWSVWCARHSAVFRFHGELQRVHN
jgi:WD40 repeat protein